jgi:hypothetical protein
MTTANINATDTNAASAATSAALVLATPIAAANTAATTITAFSDAARDSITNLETSFFNFWNLFNTKNLDNKDVAEKAILQAGLDKIKADCEEKINKSNGETETIKLIISQCEKDIENLIKPKQPEQTQNQVGGKKIISRTHKSINQFLNPKITAANIKSKRFRNTKSKSKYNTKKRTRY